MVVRVRVSNKGRKISKKSQRSLNTKLKQLPSEILVQIASKLPVTKILQCSLPLFPPLSHKNNGFDNIISDPMFPSFFQSHNNNKNSSKKTTFLAYNDVTNSCTLIDYSPDHLSEFRFDSMNFIRGLQDDIRTRFFVVNSCNGWVLFYSLTRHGDSLRLGNPITRRCLVLPQSPYAPAWPDLNYGLGYGSKTGLLKVVRLCHRRGSAKITAEVMTVRDEGDSAWKVIDKEWSVGFMTTQRKSVLLNGALHWLAYDNDDLIIRFDIDQEKFDFIPSPHTTNKEKSKMVMVSHLCVLDGLLCVGASGGLANDRSVEIWVMKEYGIEKSWTRFTVIDGLVFNEHFVLTPEIKDGKMILLTKFLRNLPVQNFFVDVYDCELRKRVKRVPLFEGMDIETRLRMTVDYFVPSFSSNIFKL